MTRHYEHVLAFALDHPWALTRPMLAVVAGILARHIGGQGGDRAAIEAALVNRKNLPQPGPGSVALIPVYGVLAPRINLMSDMSGGTTYERLTGQVQDAAANKAVKTIVLDIDSPGGSVAGMSEFSRVVMAARKRKAVVAQIQYVGCSAAYGIAAAAGTVIASPSSLVGSVGVYTAHDDISEALAAMGIKRTYIAAGDGKVAGNETEPLTGAALDRITARVDTAYQRFVADVVAGRGQGVTAERVKKDWGAHVYGADEALALGMIDEIGTLADTLGRLLSTSTDPADRALAAHYTGTGDTPQEQPTPSVVTGQDRPSDAHWQNAFERELLSLEI